MLKYELYRSLGLDESPWDPPVTITLRVWGESVDVNWSILKQVQCGQVITLDQTVSWEFAGDYEVMERTIYPFQGDASQLTAAGGDPSEVTGSSEIAQAADQNSGMIELVLRTYNDEVFFDESDTPTYAIVPQTGFYF